MSSRIRDALLKADVLISIATFEEGVKMDEVDKIRSEIKSAIAEPLKNYEVGTAEEQVKRFDDFVRDRRGDNKCTGKCPAHNGVDFGVVGCVIQWAQMPYEEVK